MGPGDWGEGLAAGDLRRADQRGPDDGDRPAVRRRSRRVLRGLRCPDRHPAVARRHRGQHPGVAHQLRGGWPAVRGYRQRAFAFCLRPAPLRRPSSSGSLGQTRGSPSPVLRRLREGVKMSQRGTVKLTRTGRDDSSMARSPSSFSRHTSPHPTHETNAFSAHGGEQLEAGGVPHERDSARVHVPREIVARARRT